MAGQEVAAAAEAGGGEWNLRGMLSHLVRTMGIMMVINHVMKTVTEGMKGQGPQHGDTSRNPVRLASCIVTTIMHPPHPPA